MITRERIKISLVGVLGALLLKLIHLTIRWENKGKLSDPFFWNTGGVRIMAFWHGRQLLMPFSKTDFERIVPLYVLISEHRDGRMIAAVVKWLGISSVAGSSSKRGGRAAKELLGCLESGAHIAITPDGPKGPCYKVKPGVIFLASQSGKPIFPITYGAKKKWTFKSWDQMILPKPFTKAVRIVGEPLYIPEQINAEQLAIYQQELGERLKQITDQADSYVYS